MWLMFDNNSQCSKEWTKKFPELKKDQVRLIMYERNGVESMFISEERSQSSWQEQIMFIDCTNVKNTCAGECFLSVHFFLKHQKTNNR